MSVLPAYYNGGQPEVAFLHSPLGHSTTQRLCFIHLESPCYPLICKQGPTIIFKSMMRIKALEIWIPFCLSSRSLTKMMVQPLDIITEK